MLVFVDESGDAGLKIESGSSPFFVVTTLVFLDHEAAQRCDEEITKLRARLNCSAKKEFHFNKDSDRIKDAFFEAIELFDFWYSAVVLNKAGLTSPGFSYKDSLYKYTVSLAFQNIFEDLNDAIVVFDRCGGREFTNQLRNYLRRAMNRKAGQADHGKIKKVKDGHSHTDNLLQLADMICGAVAKCYSCDKTGRRKFRNKLRRKERRVQVWPKMA